jgi:hypothetical protein
LSGFWGVLYKTGQAYLDTVANRADQGTLLSFGYTHYGVLSGAVAVLHTWGQNLSLHPHIHCIVPAAGFTITGKWKKIGHSGQYLYSVHQISESFKGRLLDSLKRALRKRK